jgi:1-deoxy-D-xylulose-5-phosphate synthase
MVLAAPKDERELRDLLYTGVQYTAGPFGVRFPRGSGPGAPTDEPMQAIPIGQAELLREGRDVTLLGFGTTVTECLKAADILDEAGISATVVNARFAKPLDSELIVRLARETGGIVTAEENVLAGGFGDAVLELLAQHALGGAFLDAIAMPDAIVDHGPQTTMRKLYQLDASGIAQRTQAALARTGASPQPAAAAAR